MYQTTKIQWKLLAFCLLLCWGVSGLSALVTRNFSDVYQNLRQPPFAPPGFVFPIVWSILFALMGISLYLVLTADVPRKREALLLFAAQLVANFLWPILFFNAGAFLWAFVDLLVLWVLIFLMIRAFLSVRPLAGWLQVPYLLWVTFAGYLNLGVFLLNRAG